MDYVEIGFFGVVAVFVYLWWITYGKAYKNNDETLTGLDKTFETMCAVAEKTLTVMVNIEDRKYLQESIEQTKKNWNSRLVRNNILAKMAIIRTLSNAVSHANAVQSTRMNRRVT